MSTTPTSGDLDRREALPTQFCLVVGTVLLVAGIIGFFYNSTFTSDESVRDAVFGVLDVNGWHNVVHVVTGLATLALARYAPRMWAGAFGALYLVVAIWGFVVGDGDSILSIIPVNTEDNVLHLVLGLSGLAVYAATAAERRTTAPPPRPAGA
jgi:hypothetical protein